MKKQLLGVFAAAGLALGSLGVVGCGKGELGGYDPGNQGTFVASKCDLDCILNGENLSKFDSFWQCSDEFVFLEDGTFNADGTIGKWEKLSANSLVLTVTEGEFSGDKVTIADIKFFDDASGKLGFTATFSESFTPGETQNETCHLKPASAL